MDLSNTINNRIQAYVILGRVTIPSKGLGLGYMTETKQLAMLHLGLL